MAFKSSKVVAEDVEDDEEMVNEEKIAMFAKKFKKFMKNSKDTLLKRVNIKVREKVHKEEMKEKSNVINIKSFHI